MAVGNLAPLIPALFTGPNGERLTADQIKRRQEIAESLIGQATDSSPNAGGMASILSKVGLGLTAGFQRGRAERAGDANAAESQKRLSSMLSTFTGGAPASSTAPSIGGLPPAVSTGAGAELAATSPAVATNIDMSGNELYSSFIDTVRQGGLTNPYGLAAVAATGKAESGWSPQNANRTWSDPSESGQPGTAGGIMSWRGPRYQALAATGDLSPQGQARFFLQEDPNLIAKLNSAKSLEEAQSAINQAWAFAGYDRPGGEAARRLSYAQGYLPMFQGKGEVAALTPQGAIESVAPASGGQPPEFDAGRFGDHINLAEMPPSASTLPSSLIDQGSNYVPAPPMTASPREIAAAPSVAQALVQPSAPVVAQPPVVAPPSIAQPQINPVVIEALTSPYSSPEERQVAQMLFSDFQQEKDRAEKQALAQQQRAAEIARRQAIAQQTGIDPSYAADDDIWKGAAGNLFAAPSTSTVNGAVIDNRTGQPIYQAPAETYRQVYGDEAAAMGLDPSKAYNIGPDGKISPIGEGGVTVNNNMGNDKFGEEFAKLDANALGAVSASGLAAQRNIGRINQLDELLKSSPTGFEGALAQRAGEWGIKTEGLDTIQAAQAAINSLVPEQRQPGSGPMSDADLALFKQSLPRIINQPGGNQLIIGTMRSIAQYDAEGAQIVQQLRNNEIDRAQAFQMLQSRPNPLESFKVPAQQENPLPPQTNGRKTSTGATWEVLD